jgi:hypothetical protein
LRGIEKRQRPSLDAAFEFADLICADFDLDILDRTFAPATSGTSRRPWGASADGAAGAAFTPECGPSIWLKIDPSRDAADTIAYRRGFLAFVCVRVRPRLRG